MSHSLETAERFFRAIEAGDIEAVRGLYSVDAKIWHNTDQLQQTVSENMRVLSWMIKNIPERRYRIVTRWGMSEGFAQQHVLELGTARGRYAMPACIIAKVSAGRITRLDEYLDSAHVAAMRDALGI